MKKLIVAAAIVCAAVVSQAAAIEWEIYGMMDSADANDYSGAVTLYVTALDGSGASATFNGSVSGGEMDIMIGDGSSGTAGFFQEGVEYTMYYTAQENGMLYTSETISPFQATHPSANEAIFTDGSWAAVPEPTSGLLLLLGVAGLALKRKRA